MNINMKSFLGALNSGKFYDKSSKFAVSVFPPSGVTFQEYYSYYAKSATVPQLSYGTFDHTLSGVTYSVPNSKVLEDIQVIFHNNGDGSIYDLFQAWYHLVYDKKGGYFNYPETYTGSVLISQMSGDDGSEKYQHKYHMAWVKNVGELSYDYSDSDNLQTFNVTFSYYDYDKEKI